MISVYDITYVIGMRMPFNISTDQIAALCAREKEPGAAIAEYLAKRQNTDSDDAFGFWGADAGDGLAFQEKARAEW